MGLHQKRCCLCAQVTIQAYLMWEKAGRPDGADFAGDARRTLEGQVTGGMSLQDLERALKAPEPQVTPVLTALHCSPAWSCQFSKA